ncbi:MAG: hypothetical protein RMZ43_008155 [Nostoc sp. CmiVER01]|uniref:hypothetical protein n=1 Tax=Nostoc sp. CmiVER01 TaxID=3075384 RepID=UPI002AD4A3F1|nr:hypothetical protein [Nostoc sp. CmiVER01]MDZ8123324.1 hypothetical protein [Nostoc sp. CmiVER01]
MKNINAFKKQIEDYWMNGFKEEYEIENIICEDTYFQDLHHKMVEINSPDNFWNFYFKLKRNNDFIISKI